MGIETMPNPEESISKSIPSYSEEELKNHPLIGGDFYEKYKGNLIRSEEPIKSLLDDKGNPVYEWTFVGKKTDWNEFDAEWKKRWENQPTESTGDEE